MEMNYVYAVGIPVIASVVTLMAMVVFLPRRAK